VCVEHRLLALARISPHHEHLAVAEPDVRHLDRRGHPGEHHHLVRPVELIGLARRELIAVAATRGRDAARCLRRPRNLQHATARTAAAPSAARVPAACRFHRHDPRPRSPKHNQGEHSTIRGWVAIRRCSQSRVTRPRCFPADDIRTRRRARPKTLPARLRRDKLSGEILEDRSPGKGSR
jgi:hypothetical protein